MQPRNLFVNIKSPRLTTENSSIYLSPSSTISTSTPMNFNVSPGTSTEMSPIGSPISIANISPFQSPQLHPSPLQTKMEAKRQRFFPPSPAAKEARKIGLKEVCQLQIQRAQIKQLLQQKNQVQEQMEREIEQLQQTEEKITQTLAFAKHCEIKAEHEDTPDAEDWSKLLIAYRRHVPLL